LTIGGLILTGRLKWLTQFFLYETKEGEQENVPKYAKKQKAGDSWKMRRMIYES
jgi:hypothetical protein